MREVKLTRPNFIAANRNYRNDGCVLLAGIMLLPAGIEPRGSSMF